MSTEEDKLRVLYLEDNPVDADLVRRTLGEPQSGFSLEVADSLVAGRSRLAPESPSYEVVLVDLRLPDGNGLELLTEIRGRRLPVAVVVLTGSGGRKAAIAALRAGADDYLVKDQDYLEQLPAVITGAWQHFQRYEAGRVRCLRVLYAEPDGERHGEVADYLHWHAPHITLERVFGGDEALGRLLGDPAAAGTLYDVVLLDFKLPDRDTLEVVKELRNQWEKAPPVVLIGDLGSEREVAEALRLEVGDYLIRRPGYLYGLPATLEQVAQLRQLQDEQRALRASEERHRLQVAALNASRDGVVITDLEPKIISVNPAFTTITGYHEKEVRGKSPSLLKSGHHDRAFYQSMWAQLKQQGFWQGEVWNRRKDGEVYPELLSISTVYDEAGEPSHYVGVKTDLTNLRRSEERLQHLAHHDHLTGLPNRLLLEALLEHALERAQREQSRLAVLVLNCDRFRTINESVGYAAGDELLVAVVKRLQSILRAEDTLARLAGDEFALVLEGLDDYREVEFTLQRLWQVLEQPFALPDGYEVHIQASVGISFYPQDDDTVAGLLVRADGAVNQAKDGGGNRCYYATSTLNEESRRGLELEAALRRALQQREFLLYYQPKVALAGGRITGAEALIRWQRPGHGLVAPGEFIPAAERSGLIVAMGAWVIDEGCRQLRRWREEGLGDLRLAVNVSASQFRAPGLVTALKQALAEHRVAAGQLTLELTESMLMSEPEAAIARMEELKALGVGLALDDFGTGYSSFANLSRFPIDQLKIDRSFVEGIVSSPDAATIAASIIAMAHQMRLKVVAEGVENQPQANYLRRNGCDEIQGFLFSKPLPAADFARLLEHGRTLAGEVEPAAGRTLLLVDDDPHILSSLQRLLVDEGYHLLTATDAGQGLDLLAAHRVQVIIADQRMPGMSGVEFLSRAKKIYPDTVRMVLSGYAELETVVEAVNEGALYKFLTKPWKDEVLRAQIADAFLYYEAIIRPRYRGSAATEIAQP